MLEELLPPHTSIRLSEEVNAEGKPFSELACEMGPGGCRQRVDYFDIHEHEDLDEARLATG